LAAQFHAEMDAEDEIDDEINDDASVIASDDSQDAPPQTPQPQPALTQGSKGVIVVVTRVLLDPLPWCNAPELTTEPTKMRLPGIEKLYFYCFIASL
jgi:hypothetical protein